MNFDDIIDRRGTHCAKWDKMEDLYGVPADDGIAMWVADMDFKPPQVALDAVQATVDHGVYGYFGDDRAYKNSIIWWMKNRHGWDVDADAIFTTHGIVNATAVCIDAFTKPDDGVVLFTPVYHAFAKIIKAAGRQLVEMPMTLENGRYTLDFDTYDSAMTGNERMLILCSPHNPGGRVWSQSELHAIAHFAKRHDLILVSDEIHHDLVFPGHKHIPMANIEGIEDRLVMMTAPSKTFNIAGLHTGNVIIPDAELRTIFAARMAALGLSPNSVGLFATTAVYSPEGAKWVDGVIAYLDENRKIFDAGVNSIPGVQSMPMESTYLAWVDFSGTGMTPAEANKRVQEDAKIAANHGPTFGKGGETYLRFNLGAPRSVIEDAVTRLQKAFADLQ